MDDERIFFEKDKLNKKTKEILNNSLPEIIRSKYMQAFTD